MVNNLKVICFILGGLIVSGCAKSPDPNYVYTPKTLSKELIKALHKNVQTPRTKDSGTTVEFNEAQSLLIYTHTNDDDRYYFELGSENILFDDLCNDTSPFYTFLREKGIGIQVNLSGIFDERQSGPWNSDVCLSAPKS